MKNHFIITPHLHPAWTSLAKWLMISSNSFNTGSLGAMVKSTCGRIQPALFKGETTSLGPACYSVTRQSPPSTEQLRAHNIPACTQNSHFCTISFSLVFIFIWFNNIPQNDDQLTQNILEGVYIQKKNMQNLWFPVFQNIPEGEG